MGRAVVGVGTLAILLAAATGCGKGAAVNKVFKGDAQWVLAAPERFELLTIDPSHEGFDEHAAGTMHGYRIMGMAVVTDTAEIQRLVDGLYAGVRNKPESAAACFNPRHAVRATRGGKTVDVIVCFACSSLEVYGSEYGSSQMSDTGKAAFDASVAKAGLPVAP